MDEVRQHFPDDDASALERLLEREATAARGANAVEPPRRDEPQPQDDLHPEGTLDAELDVLAERWTPRSGVPRWLDRWPFNRPRVGNRLLAAWNRLSRNWRDIGELCWRMLRTLEARLERLERAERAARARARTVNQLRADVVVLENRVADLQARLRAASAGDAGAAFDERTVELLERVAARFRGDAAELEARMREHLPAVEAACRAAPGCAVLDLGCGHGDWLALLAAAGLPAAGVDLSPTCVQACTARGLAAERRDALQALARAPAGSLAAVTAFHLIEHLELGDRIALFTRAFAALAPGGVLVLETPNPVNLQVMNEMFWSDPTHKNPLPGSLLQVFAQAAGFERAQIELLHPPSSLPMELEDYPPRMRHLLFCGMDTVLRAWKGGPPALGQEPLGQEQLLQGPH